MAKRYSEYTIEGLLTITDGISPYTLPGSVGSVGDVLTIDSGGNVEWQVGGGDGDGIYDGSGSLSSNTFVTLTTNSLQFGSNGNVILFHINGSTDVVSIGASSPSSASKLYVKSTDVSHINAVSVSNVLTSGTDNIGVHIEVTNGGGGDAYSMQLVDGTEGLNKVLTSDANGKASWQTAAGGINGFYAIPNSSPLIEAIDWNNSESQTVDFELKSVGAVAFTLSNPVNGQAYTLKITQGTAISTITWPASVLWEGGTSLVPTAVDNAIDIVTMIYDGTNYFASYGASHN